MIRFNRVDVIPGDLFSYQPMDIPRFLSKYTSFLLEYNVSGDPFPELLDSVCREYSVNPKLILVALQREQSLVSRKDRPSDRVLDRALGFGMTDGGDLKQFYGFRLQLLKAISCYRKHYNAFLYGASIKVDYGKAQILPETAFTFSLYKYCPHVGDDTSPNFIRDGAYGNYLTFLIWRKYWPGDLDIPDDYDRIVSTSYLPNK